MGLLDEADGMGGWVARVLYRCRPPVSSKAMPAYLPPAERRPSTQYQDMLRTIRDTGVRVETKQGVQALAVAGVQMRFPMAHGAAVITERSIGGFYDKAIGELCAFINGARTLDEFKAFGCDWWGPWASESKCLSRGLQPVISDPAPTVTRSTTSHTDLDDPDAPGFDQLPALIQKLKDLPLDRTALLSPWIPQANHRTASIKSRNTIAPCHGWIHAMVLGDKLHIIPQPALRGYARRRAVEHGAVHGARPDARAPHRLRVRRVRALDPVRAHLRQPARRRRRDAGPRAARLPTLELTEAGKRVTDIHDFRSEHFTLSDYDPHPGIRDIPVLT